MIFEVGVEEVWVYGVDDVAGDKERVCVGAGEGAGGLAAGGEVFGDALHYTGEEVSARALAEEGAYFFVIEEGDHADLRGLGECWGRVEERLDSSPGTQLVVDAAGEDEFAVETTGLGGLRVEEFEFPVYD